MDVRKLFLRQVRGDLRPRRGPARRIGAELLARPAREPLREAVVDAVLAYYEDADGESLAWLRLVVTAHICGNGVWFDSRAWIVTARRH